jgi:hypothetical protein
MREADLSDTTKPIQISQSLAVCIWRALREEERTEADLLASAIIGSGFEPIFEDNAEGLDFYREYLIAHGLLEDTTSTH